MKKTAYLSLALIPLLIFPNALAQQSADQSCGTTTFDCYQETGFRLTGNPVICMDLPSDRNVIALLRAYTQDAVMDWQNKINNAGMSWNIQLLPDTTSNACNITIHYLPHPTSSENYPIDVTGATTLNADNTALIEVFYNDVAVDDQGSYYFLDSLGPDYQLHWTIKHELGHAFGLGHYIVSDNSTIASIMIPKIPLPYTVPDDAGVITPQPVITTGDAVQLKSLYPNGFSDLGSQQVNSSEPSVPSPEMSSSDVGYWIPQIRNYFENSTNNPDSNDYSVNVLELVDVFDSKHLTSIPDPVGNQTGIQFRMYMQPWLANDVSFWASGEISDSDLASAMQYLYNNGMFYFR